MTLLSFRHLVHSIDASEGGVASSVLALNESLKSLGVKSVVCTDPTDDNLKPSKDCIRVAHGLWHWPTTKARSLKKKHECPYFVFPHGMLDPWFKKTYPIKHLKKQAYWWLSEGRAVNNANAVCFTTDEEKTLARKTFFPYDAKEEVVGLGVEDSPLKIPYEKNEIIRKFPIFQGKRLLLYLGRFHPKKGVDMLLEAWIEKFYPEALLVLAGPTNEKNPYLKDLIRKSKSHKNVIWTGMLEGNEKWEMLSLADALILPSHQENFGMVVAEALAMGKPVYLTNKVNLWREVLQAKAGFVCNDDQAGVYELLEKWEANANQGFYEKARNCFEQKLHIRGAAERLIALAENTFKTR